MKIHSLFLSHPDYTVGSGISPDRPPAMQEVRRLYCRWGISPRPEELIFILHMYSMLRDELCQPVT